MKIIIRNNRIEYSSIPLKKGPNLLAEVEGFVNPETFELCHCSSSLAPEITPMQIYARGGVVMLDEQDKFSWISPDASAFRDIFYVKLPDNKFLLCDDFFQVLPHLNNLTIKKSTIDYFIRHGYLGSGRTFFEEIPRIKIGNKLKFINNQPREESIWEIFSHQEPKRDYPTFKKVISSVLSCLKISDNDGIFLSSGFDSGLIAALSALKFSKYPFAVTFRFAQTFKPNRVDAEAAKNITEFLGLRHLIIDIDFNKETLAHLESFVKATPLGGYEPLSYFRSAQEIAKRQITRLWSGENGDYVYNLGPTVPTKGPMVKRFYLSKEYLRSLSDITNKSRFGFVYRLIGEMGKQGFYFLNGYDLKQPKTFQELWAAFEASQESLALPFRNSNFQPNSSFPQLTSLGARKHMFERFVQYFFAGRDGRAVQAAAENCGLKPILPYSATNVIHFFRGLEMNFRDTLTPKRFIRQYLKELIGKNNYQKLYILPRKQSQKSIQLFLRFPQWQEKILKQTRFGRQLKEFGKEVIYSDRELRQFQELLDANNIYYSTAIFWLGNILKKAKELGKDINFIE